MIEIKDLTIELFSGKKLIEKLSFILNEGDKLAIIGEEGNGKSCLLKAIFDTELIFDFAKVEGNINKNGLKLGYLEQMIDSMWYEQTIAEYMLKNFPTQIIDWESYNRLKEITQLFPELGLDIKIIENDQKIKTLSGGEKVKLQLVKILSNEPDVLLLDEPTNDLDIETLEWLEQFLIKEQRPIIYVSHDETLLERTANRILHIEQLKKKTEPKQTLENIGYKEYVDLRIKKLQKQEQQASSEKRKFEEMKATLNDLKSSVRSAQINIKDSSVRRTLNKKMKNIITQEKKLENEELTEWPDVEEEINLFFSRNISIPNGKEILNLNLNELKLKNGEILKNIKLNIKGAKKIVIIGRNGIGKTTLLKKVKEELEKTKNIKLGYFPQDYEEILDYNLIALEYLMQGFEGSSINEAVIRAYMGNLKFTRDEMVEKIGNLSGGSKAKLILLRMVLDECNVLILDEPTRNLSPLSNPVIREMLKDYKGAIISISHDRKFIEEVVDEVYDLSQKSLFLL